MQPLARLSHSVAVLEPEETVRGFSRSVVLPNSGSEVRLCFVFEDGLMGGLDVVFMCDLPFRMTAIFLPWRAVRM
jgi:hypothetical protein